MYSISVHSCVRTLRGDHLLVCISLRPPAGFKTITASKLLFTQQMWKRSLEREISLCFSGIVVFSHVLQVFSAHWGREIHRRQLLSFMILLSRQGHYYSKLSDHQNKEHHGTLATGHVQSNSLESLYWVYDNDLTFTTAVRSTALLQVHWHRHWDRERLSTKTSRQNELQIKATDKNIETHTMSFMS